MAIGLPLLLGGTAAARFFGDLLGGERRGMTGDEATQQLLRSAGQIQGFLPNPIDRKGLISRSQTANRQGAVGGAQAFTRSLGQLGAANSVGAPFALAQLLQGARRQNSSDRLDINKVFGGFELERLLAALQTAGGPTQQAVDRSKQPPQGLKALGGLFGSGADMGQLAVLGRVFPGLFG